MKLLLILTPAPGTRLDQVAAVLPREEPALWRLMTRGTCRGIWYDAAVPGQVVLELEAADVPEAERAMNELPLVSERVMRATLLPLLPYDGLSLMFRGEFGFAPALPPSWTAA